MRKSIVFVVALFAFFFIFHTPVSGAGIFINTDNGDRIAVLEDIKSNDKTQGNVITVIGNININDEVDGDIVALVGNIRVNAKVTGHVVSVFGEIELAEGANIGGHVVSVGNINKRLGAQVSGEVVELYRQGQESEPGKTTVAGALLVLIFSLAVLILGVLLIAISKDKYAAFSENVDYNAGKKLLTGFGGLLCATIVTVVLAITVITPVLYLAFMVAAGVFSSIYAGKIILKAFKSGNSAYLQLITGLATITFIKTALIFIAPWDEYMVNSILYLCFVAFINSMGIGIMLNTKWI